MEIYLIHNRPFLRKLKEKRLREMANITSNYLANLIRNAFITGWDISLNEDFARQVANDVINEVTKDCTLNLMKNWIQKIKIKTQTNEDRNNALRSIKKFVDATIAICEEKTKNTDTYGFADYFSDKKRITQLYTALSIRIAKWYKIPITDDYWNMCGFTPL